MASRTKEMSSAAQAVLARATIEGLVVKLPPGQLDRKLYVEVNEGLVSIGGKWKGGKTMGHVFESNPADKLARLVGEGVIGPKNPEAFFETPPEVVALIRSLLLARMSNPAAVLEPSAGRGAIAKMLRATYPEARLDMVEVNEERIDVLGKLRIGHVIMGSFLDVRDTGYELVAMNPPFAVADDATAWITHLRHAWGRVASGGRIVCVVPAGAVFRDDRKHREVRETVSGKTTIVPLPAGTFKDSGTAVNTALLVYDRF